VQGHQWHNPWEVHDHLAEVMCVKRSIIQFLCDLISADQAKHAQVTLRTFLIFCKTRGIFSGVTADNTKTYLICQLLTIWWHLKKRTRAKNINRRTVTEAFQETWSVKINGSEVELNYHGDNINWWGLYHITKTLHCEITNKWVDLIAWKLLVCLPAYGFSNENMKNDMLDHNHIQ